MKKINRSLLRVQACALVLVAFGSAFAQETHIHESGINIRAGAQEDLQFHYDNFDRIENTVTETGQGTAFASAQLGFGVNKVAASFSTIDPNNPTDTLRANGWTRWADLVTITSDEVANGTMGSFTASMQVFGNADIRFDSALMEDFDSDFYGIWDSWIGVSMDNRDSFLVGGWFGEWRKSPEVGISYDGPELNQAQTEVTLDFIYGEPFWLGGSLEVYVGFDNYNLVPGNMSANLDFSHSAYWNGISSVTDGSGNAVGFNIDSQSGTNWAQPVPEPGTMAVLGLGGLALLRRRRRG